MARQPPSDGNRTHRDGAAALDASGRFTIEARDPLTRARAGVLQTPHGPIETPVFMPVATQASVKSLSQEDLEALGVRAILANAYHLYLRPGVEMIGSCGGLHAFMSYPGAILTDSGGFQGMSLAELRRIDDDGIMFKSHLDGSAHTLTPEKAMAIQEALGADIRTSLDECVRWPCDEASATRALERTLSWTRRCGDAFLAGRSTSAQPGPLFFPVIQGSVYPPLRRRAVEHLDGVAHDGVSIGGFCVGEPKQLMWEALSATTECMPTGAPRYLMGLGTPEDLWEAVSLGVDMTDCVWPTRTARHGSAMTRNGRLNLLNAASRKDTGPLDGDCDCVVCRKYSRAYIAHLFRAREMAGARLVSMHNLHFLMEMMRGMRRAILEKRFAQAKARFLGLHQGARRQALHGDNSVGGAKSSTIRAIS